MFDSSSFSGGTLHLFSAPNEGTTAELWLPAGGSGAAEVEPRPNPTSQAEPSPDTTSPATILVVDEALIAMSTVDLIEDLGYSVFEANSESGALEILRSGSPVDLIDKALRSSLSAEENGPEN